MIHRLEEQMPLNFDVVVERDSEGWFVASVPALRGCHSQARSLEELADRIQEAIEVSLEASPDLHRLDARVRLHCRPSIRQPGDGGER